jgi:hypothetical protein
MGRNSLIELADALSGEEEVRKREEGDSGPFLGRLAEFLENRVHGIIGGLGVRAYVRERPTMDFDVMIDSKEWASIKQFLVREGAELQGTLEETRMYTFQAFRMELDIRVAKSSLDQESLRHTKIRSYKKWKLRVVEPDYLAAMKVKAYSERKELPQGKQDRSDVRRLIDEKHARDRSIRTILKKHRPDLVPALDEILS